MATQRMIKTSLWRKSRKFKQCDPLEKLLFIYLITNDDTELCGAYEQDMDEIAFHTGIDYRTLPQMLKRLEEIDLAIYRDGWIVIPHYMDQQNANNPKVRAGIENSFAVLPKQIRSLVNRYRIDGVSMPHEYPTSDLDSDIDSDIDVDTDSRPAKDPTLETYRSELSALLPMTAWRDIRSQLEALHRLSKMTRETQPSTPLETPEEFARMAVKVYARLKQTGRGDYWKRAAFDPKGLELRFTDVVTEMAQAYGQEQAEEAGVEAIRRMGIDV